MKLSNLALLSLAGMLLSSSTVYSFTPVHRPAVAAHGSTTEESGPAGGVAPPPADAVASSFLSGGTLRAEGRMGHARLVRGAGGRTLVLFEIRSGEGELAKTVAPSHLAIVIDRSGSMKGDRIQNAIAAATSAIDHMGEGDVVSVVSFDTQATRVLTQEAVTAESRERLKEAIRGIKIGGDTCISCGMEEAMVMLAATRDKVDRMILLSDGEATAGVRDLPGFKRLAAKAYEQGVTVTTIGVGVSYNQKVLGAIAKESDGEHYFAENTASLDRVFDGEAERLRSTVAVSAEASIELAAGVELERVFDRSFRREGRKIIVPLGSFERKDAKTVLLEVRVPSATDGKVAVAELDLAYKDLVRGEAGHCGGKLEVRVGGDGDAGALELDALVSGRLNRSETAAALLTANELLEKGKTVEAARHIAARQTALAEAEAKAKHAAPSARGGDVARDFGGQAASLDNASGALNRPSPKPAAAVRANQAGSNPFSR